jgi:succinate dehydrogenase / fumarate reductase cytochrome b subunit
MNLLPQPVRSSLGKKYLMALTGLLLIGFVVAHMSGNLLIYLGRDALNTYAQTLKAHPGLLWAARLSLLAIFLVHIFLALKLHFENSAARPSRYVYEDTLHASWASRHMLLTGLVLFAFIVYHLAHFTLGWVKQAEVESKPGIYVMKHYLDLAEVKNPAAKGFLRDPDLNLTRANQDYLEIRHDVYTMVVSGFKVWWVSLSYLVAMVFLGLHLWHGGSSFLQSLGLNSLRYSRLVWSVGPFLAILVVVGNCSIPIAVLLGVIQ